MNAPMQAWMLVTGWTLIHFVWQGGLLAVATAVGLRLCRRRSSATRYAVACLGLMAMLAAPAVTAAVLWEPASVTPPAETGRPAVSGEAIHSSNVQPAPDRASRSANGAAGIRLELDPWLPYVVWTWIAGVVLLMARFAGGSWRVHRLHVASRAEAVSPWQAAGERLAGRLRLDVAFRVVESGLVDTPSVIGFLRPVILLPVAILSNLSTGQVEALLAHELAHIRRRDYAVNMVQTAAETLLFFHPAVWWVSSRIREEREHCCDDVAVEVCGEPTAYAAALAELASWRSREIALSVGAAGGPLLARVRRLVGAPEEDVPRSASGLALLAIGLMLTAGVAVQSTAQDSSSPGPLANRMTAAGRSLQLAGTWASRKTDHFDIYYPPDLDLHAERVGREAERAYEHVSSDLKHNLAFRVPILLFPTAGDFEKATQAGGSERPQATSATNPEGDRILLAVDQPADQWFGGIVHEVAHVFAFDILPGTSYASVDHGGPCRVRTVRVGSRTTSLRFAPPSVPTRFLRWAPGVERTTAETRDRSLSSGTRRSTISSRDGGSRACASSSSRFGRAHAAARTLSKVLFRSSATSSIGRSNSICASGLQRPPRRRGRPGSTIAHRFRLRERSRRCARPSRKASLVSSYWCPSGAVPRNGGASSAAASQPLTSCVA